MVRNRYGRIDSESVLRHLLLSPEAANRLTGTSVEKHVRAWEKPSDHVPTVAHLAFAAR